MCQKGEMEGKWLLGLSGENKHLALSTLKINLKFKAKKKMNLNAYIPDLKFG